MVKLQPYNMDFKRLGGPRKNIGASYAIAVSPGTPSPTTSAVTGAGVASVAAGTTGLLRVQLRDAAGNAAGTGAYRASGPPAAGVPIVEGNLVPASDPDNPEKRVRVDLDYSEEEGLYRGAYVVTSTGRYDLEILLYGDRVSMPEGYLGKAVQVEHIRLTLG